MAVKKKVEAKKRQSYDPIINHIKRAVKKIKKNSKVRGLVDLGKLMIPGVGGSDLIRKAEKKIKKAVESK